MIYNSRICATAPIRAAEYVLSSGLWGQIFETSCQFEANCAICSSPREFSSENSWPLGRDPPSCRNVRKPPLVFTAAGVSESFYFISDIFAVHFQYCHPISLLSKELDVLLVNLLWISAIVPLPGHA